MARWPVLVGFSITFTALGCASPSQVTAGLANAPGLGGTSVGDERQHDVVANGHDSCESVTGRSPLRGHLPPCPTASHPVAAASWEPTIGANDESLVLPWLQHFYAGWPCTRSAAAVESRAVAWTTPAPAPSTCASLERSPWSP